MKDRKEDKLQRQRLLEGKKSIWGDGDIFLIGTYIPLCYGCKFLKHCVHILCPVKQFSCPGVFQIFNPDPGVKF